MTIYTEEKELQVTLDEAGNKSIRTTTITYKDGVEVGSTNHRHVINAEDDVPADLAAFIEGKKGKQPPSGNPDV